MFRVFNVIKLRRLYLTTMPMKKSEVKKVKTNQGKEQRELKCVSLCS